jgi:hypothetical protein
MAQDCDQWRVLVNTTTWYRKRQEMSWLSERLQASRGISYEFNYIRMITTRNEANIKPLIWIHKGPFTKQWVGEWQTKEQSSLLTSLDWFLWQPVWTACQYNPLISTLYQCCQHGGREKEKGEQLCSLYDYRLDVWQGNTFLRSMEQVQCNNVLGKGKIRWQHEIYWLHGHNWWITVTGCETFVKNACDCCTAAYKV